MDRKIILTDYDGVLGDWENHFHTWMRARGYAQKQQGFYHVEDLYGISAIEGKRMVCEFNNSAWIGWMPALRDARSGIATLYENGYNFVCVTSLSSDPYAKELRWQNIRHLFGNEAFVDLVCLETGANKDQALAPYQGSGLYWLEDLPKNAVLGADLGLNTIIVDHAFNRELNDSRIRRAKSWREIAGIILNERQHSRAA